ncbi:MAG TPA: signal peptidase II [Longimicrobium sp.]|nr:signal peptidase II [Longimicrobium sp.]
MHRSNHRVHRTLRRLLGHRRTTHRPGAPPGRRASDHEPMHGWKPALALALAVALLDWGAKAGIRAAMGEGDFVQVIPGRLAFWHVVNHAMILGLWEDLPLVGRKWIAGVAALVGAFLLLQILGRGHRFPRHHRRWAVAFVGLVMGGMLGNLGERAVHWGVTDFISIRWGEYWLPPGNIADLALFLSFPLALVVMAFEIMGRARRRPQAAPEPGAASAD